MSIIDSQTCIHTASWTVDVNLNVAVGIAAFQKQQLTNDDIGYIIINGHTQENDAVHHQTGEDVHGYGVHLPFLNDVWREACNLRNHARLRIAGLHFHVFIYIKAV
jgi:hypothetical protein